MSEFGTMGFDPSFSSLQKSLSKSVSKPDLRDAQVIRKQCSGLGAMTAPLSGRRRLQIGVYMALRLLRGMVRIRR